MRARELAEQIPTVRMDTTGVEAARLVAEYRLQGLVVLGDDGVPNTVIPGSQILGLILPTYLRDDPALAHAIDERGADEMCRRLTRATIGQLIADQTVQPTQLPAVSPDDTIVEVAAVMVEGHHPLVLVMGVDGRYHGVVTMSRLLAAIASLAGQDSALIQRRLTRDIIDRGQPWPQHPEEGNEGRP